MRRGRNKHRSFDYLEHADRKLLRNVGFRNRLPVNTASRHRRLYSSNTAYITVLKSYVAINLEKICKSSSDRTGTEWKSHSTDAPQNSALPFGFTSMTDEPLFFGKWNGTETNHKHVLHNELEILQSCRCTAIFALLRDLSLCIKRNKITGLTEQIAHTGRSSRVTANTRMRKFAVYSVHLFINHALAKPR